jgi:hypothetical protein
MLGPLPSLQGHLRQLLAVRTEVNFLADLHNGTANEARLLEHEIDQIIIVKFCLIQPQRPETGRTEAEHIGGRFPLQQRLDFRARERGFEKIAVVDCYFFLRKKLFCFPAGGSLIPTEKINFHYRFSSHPCHSPICFQVYCRSAISSRTPDRSSPVP